MYAGAVVVVVATVGGLVLRLLLGRDRGDGMCVRLIDARHVRAA